MKLSNTHSKKLLQYKSTLQPYILVRVDAGVEVWAWTTLQPYNTNLPTNRRKTACSNG